MNRRGFVGRLMAALGIGAVGARSLGARETPRQSRPAPPLGNWPVNQRWEADSDDKVTFTTTNHATSSSTLWIDMRSMTVGVR